MLCSSTVWKILEIYINDSEMDRWVKDQMSGKLTMNDYYKQTAELRDEPWKDKTIKKIIEERYQLNDVTTDSIENSIKKIIYSDDKNESPLARELETMFKKFKNSDYKIYNFRWRSNFDNDHCRSYRLFDPFYFVSTCHSYG